MKVFQQCDYAFMALLPRQKGPDALRDVIENTDFSALMEEGFTEEEIKDIAYRNAFRFFRENL